MFLTVIYASNNEIKRRLLWRELTQLKSSMPAEPWIASGDFNVVHKIMERSDYYPGMPLVNKIQDFQKCIVETDVVDISCEGLIFTWSNKRKEGYIAKKLGRILVNA